MAALSGFVVVRDGQRQYRPPGFDGGLEQGGVEFEHPCSIAGASFWKNGDIQSRVEKGVDFLVDDARVLTFSALQEYRVIEYRQPAEERPAADFGLGDEGCRAQGIDDENVQPRDVVGDDQAAARGACRRCLEPNSENGQNLP